MRVGQSVRVAYEHLARVLDLLSNRADVTSAEVLAAVAEAFNVEFGTELDASSLGDAEREWLREYLIKSAFECGPSLHYRARTLRHLPLYEDIGAKLNWLYQHPCLVCLNGNEFPTETFPIGIPPWSHQCAPKVGRALRRAIDASPVYSQHFKERMTLGPVCLRIVFMLGKNAVMKDCDNMAKGLLDCSRAFSMLMTNRLSTWT